MELFAVLASFMSRSSVSLKSLQVKWLQRDLLPVACISYYSEKSPKTSNDKTNFLFALNEGKGK
jgi:hypothetical protein